MGPDTVPIRAAFQDRTGSPPALVAWAPGRINLIGEHTDYNGGLALPAAIDRWMQVALRPREDGQVTLASAAFDDTLSFPLDQPPLPTRSWHRYALGCLAVYRSVAPAPCGLDALLVGDVPIGSGLSSSAAFEMALLNGLRALWGGAMGDEDLVRMGQRVEHEHLGVQTGLLDQTASQLCRAGHALKVDFRDLSRSHVPAALPGSTWIVFDTGVRRELARSAYEDRVRECALGLDHARRGDGAVAHFRDLTRAHLEGNPSAGRLQHVLEENARVEAAVRALSRGDAPAMGALLLASHESLRDLYEVSCPELDSLVDLAMAGPGCLGARMVGGGFGGCTLHLVQDGAVEEVRDRVQDGFSRRFGRVPTAHRFRLVAGAGVETAHGAGDAGRAGGPCTWS